DYQKAIQQFQELVDTKQEFPFSRKIVYQSIKELPDNPPTINLKECEILVWYPLILGIVELLFDSPGRV
ncbi:unnamed protein product, partial [marine sediment metagenome]